MIGLDSLLWLGVAELGVEAAPNLSNWNALALGCYSFNHCSFLKINCENMNQNMHIE
jgi:hypothetical protein